MTADGRLPTTDDLPDGWVWTTLGEICEPIVQVNPRKTMPGELIKYVDITSVDNEKNEIVGHKEVLGREAPSRARKPIHAGDILFATVRTYLRNVAMVPSDYDGEITSTGFCVLRSSNGIQPHFVFRYLLTNEFIQQISEKQRGISYPAVTDRDVYAEPIPLPPEAEQQRIVAKMEALFQQSCRGREALDAVPDLLAQFRRAALAAAFRGDLTERAPDDEPASVLLERIRAERRRQWEEDLRAQGKDPSRYKYKEPGPPDTSDLPGLPERWEWEILEVCSDVITKGESPGWQGYEYVEEGVLFVRSENVLWGRLDYSSPVYVPEKFHKKLSRSQLQPSDVLINLVGASIGRAAIVPQDVGQANVNQAVALIRLNGSLLPSYLMYLLISPSIQRVIQGKKVDVARANISLTDLRELRIPVPPLAEQYRIVTRIEALFAQADILEAQVTAVRRRLEQVDQAILARAFRGELVPQDPDDEPASVLLERIRKEREAQATGERKRKTQQMRFPTM